MQQHVKFHEKKRTRKGCSTIFLRLLAFAFALFVLFNLTFRVIFIDGDSMQPTLESGDWLIVCRFDRPKRGDMTVTNRNNDTKSRLIKRLIAVGGDTVDIDRETGTVYVNGEALDEPYLADKTIVGGDVTFPYTVPEGCVFLLGDNRTNSVDSRYSDVGLLKESTLIGTVWMRFYPLPVKSVH